MKICKRNDWLQKGIKNIALQWFPTVIIDGGVKESLDLVDNIKQTILHVQTLF